MSTTRVAPLDSNSLYVYCDVCKANGTPNSPLIREMDSVKCQFGHVFTGSLMMTVRAHSGDQPDTANMSMVPLPIDEQPPMTSVKWSVWIHPKVRDILQQKYRGRLIATLDSIFGCLADDAVLILSGQDVAKLRKRGIKNGVQALAALEANDNLERQLQEANLQLEKFTDMLRSAGV